MQHHVPAPVAGEQDDREQAKGHAKGHAQEQEQQRLRAGPALRAAVSAALRPQSLVTWLALLLAAALWIYALPHIGFRSMGEYGLLDRLPVTYYLSLLVLTAGFVVGLRRAGTAPWWPALYCAALLMALKGVPAVLYDSVRYPWASKHDAVITHMLANGALRPDESLSGNMSAYDQWPGFFTLNGGLVRVFGVHSAAAYLNWAPIVFGLLMMPVLVLIYRTFSEDWRLVWAAVWIFQLANWVGQDYLAPQGFAYLLYLAVFA
ncbi:MAG TPA: hypothetical protein VIS29_12490, partial [Streptomyces sp.]